MSEPSTDAREFLSPQEFAASSGLSVVTVRRYLADGRLPAFQPGGRRCRVLIPRSALNQFTATLGVSRKSRQSITVTKDIIMPSTKTLAGPPPRWLADS